MKIHKKVYPCDNDEMSWSKVHIVRLDCLKSSFALFNRVVLSVILLKTSLKCVDPVFFDRGRKLINDPGSSFFINNPFQ